MIVTSYPLESTEVSNIKPSVSISEILNSSFTFAELSRRWKCTRQTLYNMQSDGELNTFKVRNCRRVTGAEVNRVEKGGAA